MRSLITIHSPVPVQRGRSPLARMLRLFCPIRPLRSRAMHAACRLEGGQMWSETLRVMLRKYFAVEFGRYSYCADSSPADLPPGTVVGNFCSIGAELSVFRRNHPSNRISQHPLFFNASSGLVPADTIHAIHEHPLLIGHGSWIGANVTVTPGCRSIGLGSVVGAGAVVTRDVPPFAIVAGNPARLRRERFSPDVQAVLLESKWWEYPLERLIPALSLFLEEATMENATLLREFLVRGTLPAEVEIPAAQV